MRLIETEPDVGVFAFKIELKLTSSKVNIAETVPTCSKTVVVMSFWAYPPSDGNLQVMSVSEIQLLAAQEELESLAARELK